MRKIRDELEQYKNDKVGEFDKVSSQLSNSERKYRLAMEDIAQLKYVLALSVQTCYLPCMPCATSPYSSCLTCMPYAVGSS
jgi:hypothetical protein